MLPWADAGKYSVTLLSIAVFAALFIRWAAFV
jgi:hypothetical protein